MRARTMVWMFVAGMLGIVGGGVIAAAPAQAVSGPDPAIAVALDRSTYRLGDVITGTFTITNRGDAPAAGIVVHVFTQSMHIDLIDFGDFRQTNVTDGVLDRELAAGETVHLIIHASATGFLLAPSVTSLTGRIDFTGDVDRTNNWREVTANYDTFGSTAVVNGIVFADANRNGVRDAGEAGGLLAEPSLWWAPGQGQGVGIDALGEYSFTGIIGQQYELHFDPYQPDKFAGTSARIYVFVLAAGGRAIDFGVADLNAPTPTLPVPTITTTDPAPGAPNPGLASGPDRVARVGGVDTESELSTVAPTQPVPSSVPTTADATEPNHARTVAGASSGSGGSSSRWLWLVSGGFGLIVLTAGGRLVMRRRRLADELSKLDSRRP